MDTSRLAPVVALTAGLALWTPQGLAAEAERTTDAWSWTVLFLMAMPYATLAGCLGWFVYRYTRSQRTGRAGSMSSKKENAR